MCKQYFIMIIKISTSFILCFISPNKISKVLHKGKSAKGMQPTVSFINNFYNSHLQNIISHLWRQWLLFIWLSWIGSIENSVSIILSSGTCTTHSWWQKMGCMVTMVIWRYLIMSRSAYESLVKLRRQPCCFN